jgi:hypothetical protein
MAANDGFVRFIARRMFEEDSWVRPVHRFGITHPPTFCFDVHGRDRVEFDLHQDREKMAVKY